MIKDFSLVAFNIRSRSPSLSKSEYTAPFTLTGSVIPHSKFIFENVKSALDLGAAPGSWSEVLVKELKSPTRIVAIDLLEVDPIPGVEIFKDDFTSKKFNDYVDSTEPFDLIVSDISPNMTGHRQTDFLRSMEMLEEAFALTDDCLNQGGHFIAKYFRRGDLGQLLNDAKKKFTKVSSFKPDASRKNSSEIYLVCYKKK